MKRRWIGPLVFIAAFLAFAAYVGQTIFLDDSRQGRPFSGISVVVYGGENNDRWRSLEQGIRQACTELNIEKPAITIARANDPARQMELIGREVDNGARGLLVAVGDSGALAVYLEEVAAGVPVVLVENGTAGSLACIAADNRAMGWALAGRLAGETGGIALLGEGLESEGVAQRYEGFMDRMAELDKEIIVLQRENPRDDLRAFIAFSLASQPEIDLLVVLENDLLETAVDAVPAAMVPVRLFGVGSSTKVVHALDQGIIEELVFQNEYAMGYIGMYTLAEQMGLVKAHEGAEIQYSLVRREYMYDSEFERLLFPIIQ